MKTERKKSNKSHKVDEVRRIGPDEGCTCPVCVFGKSQAPGDPYDVTQCPKYKKSKTNLK